MRFNLLTTSTATRWLVTSERILPCTNPIAPRPVDNSEIGSTLPGSMLALAIGVVSTRHEQQDPACHDYGGEERQHDDPRPAQEDDKDLAYRHDPTPGLEVNS